jgi:hypothetical protein
LLGIIFLGVFYKNKSNLSLFLIFSLILNLYALEFIFGNKLDLYILKKIKNRTYDTRTFFDFYETDISKKKISFNSPNLPKLILSENEFIYPLTSTKSNFETLLCNESGKWSKFKSDRFGFRNLDSLWDQKIDYIVLGDSYTFGYCVDEGYNITEKFNSKSKKKMLNLASGGTGPLYQLGILKEYISVIKKPKYVLLFYQESNDLINLDNEIKSHLRKYFLTSNIQNLTKYQKEIDAHIDNYLEKHFFSNKYNFKKFIKFQTLKEKIIYYFKNENQEFEIEFSPATENIKRLDNLKVILDHYKNFLEKENIELVFLYNPTWGRYSKKISSDDYRLKKKVLELVKKLNIKYIDIDNLVFSKHPDPLSLYHFREQSHPTLEGYDLIATFLLNNLENQIK